MIIRAVLDSGVLVAALLSSKGAPAELIRAWFDGHFELVVSPQLMSELADVLARPKFRKYVSQVEVAEFLALLRRRAVQIQDPEPQPGLTPDPRDDYLVALARSAGVNVLVSGDPHLTQLSSPHPPVVTPRSFLNTLRA